MSSTKPTDPSTNPNTDPSLLAGHAKFAKGYVAETIGNLTGSQPWQESGKADASAGIDEMKAAKAAAPAPPTSSSTFGARIEEVAGKAVGCEGMAEEGREKQQVGDSKTN